jgi:hypothetical protein
MKTDAILATLKRFLEHNSAVDDMLDELPPSKRRRVAGLEASVRAKIEASACDSVKESTYGTARCSSSTRASTLPAACWTRPSTP